MGDRDRQHTKLAEDLVAGDLGEMFSVEEFDDEDETIPRDLAALGFTTVNLRVEQPDGTLITIPTSALVLASGTYTFSSTLASELQEGNDQHIQIEKTGGGLIETTTNLLMDVQRKL